MSVELLLNVIIICLLVPTIIFAVILNKRLEVLRSSRNDLGRLIEAFNEATTRAEAGIPRLKQAADSAGAHLKEQIQKAQALRDDMAFMVERAEASTARLEGALRPSARSASEKAPAEAAPAVRAEPRGRKRPLVENPDEIMSSAVSVAEDILRDNPVRSAKNPKKGGGGFNPPEADDERSEAERELLKALQSMR